MPAWLVALVAVGTPVLAFAGAFLQGFLARRSARHTQQWQRREETMRMLRWAVELATDQDELKASTGIRILESLAESDIVEDRDQEYLESIYSIVAAVTSAIALDSLGAGAYPYSDEQFEIEMEGEDDDNSVQAD